MLGWIMSNKQNSPGSHLGVSKAWSSDKNLFLTGPWPDLIRHIFRKVYLVKGRDGEYVLNPVDDVQICAWANVMEKGHKVLAHDHVRSHHGGMNCLAGIYYVSAPKRSAPIIFYPNGLYEGRLHGGRIDAVAETSEVYAPQEGVLFLFPHDLIHMVPTHQLDEPRVSIGINIRKVD